MLAFGLEVYGVESGSPAIFDTYCSRKCSLNLHLIKETATNPFTPRYCRYNDTGGILYLYEEWRMG